MLAAERHERITALLSEHGRMTVQDLQARLAASAATIRRDLAELEHAGLLVRAHGGAMRPPHAGGEATFARKARTAVTEKRAIAALAADLVPPHSTVFVDSGSTTLEAGRRLLARPDLTLFTNSLPLLNVRTAGQARLIAIGGELREISCALVGGLALDWLQHLRFDCALIGASGLDAHEGASTTELTEAQVKRTLLSRAQRVLLLADAGKWGHPAPITFSAWNGFHDWITDFQPAPKEAARLRALGVTLHLVTSS